MRLREPSGRPRYDVDEAGQVTKEIGAIAVHANGIIACAPVHDLSPRELHILVAAGADAFDNSPSARTGWGRKSVKGRKYWRTTISIKIPPDDQSAAAIARAERWVWQQTSLERHAVLEVDIN